MGLFDGITGALGSAGPGEGGSTALDAVMHMIAAPRTGGLPGLMAAFQSGGLGEIFASWVSTGPNLPISAAQIQEVLGNERISAFAGRLGIDSEAAGARLAQWLPQVIDQLTPQGRLPDDGGDWLARGLDVLTGKRFE